MFGFKHWRDPVYPLNISRHVLLIHMQRSHCLFSHSAQVSSSLFISLFFFGLESALLRAHFSLLVSSSFQRTKKTKALPLFVVICGGSSSIQFHGTPSYLLLPDSLPSPILLLSRLASKSSTIQMIFFAKTYINWSCPERSSTVSRLLDGPACRGCSSRC